MTLPYFALILEITPLKIFLAPASAVEVIQPEPSVFPCVCPSVGALTGELLVVQTRNFVWEYSWTISRRSLTAKVKGEGHQGKIWFWPIQLSSSDPTLDSDLYYDVLTPRDVTRWRHMTSQHDFIWHFTQLFEFAGRACIYGLCVSIHHSKGTLEWRNFITRVAGGASTFRHFHSYFYD